MKTKGIRRMNSHLQCFFSLYSRQFQYLKALLKKKYKNLRMMFLENKSASAFKWVFILFIVFSLGFQSVAQTTVNEKLFLKSGNQLGRTIGSSLQTSTALYKETALVTSSGYFKTSNSGYSDGTLSSNVDNQASSTPTYTPSGSNRAIIVSIGTYVKVPELTNTISSVKFGGVNLTKKFEYQFNDGKKTGYNLKLEVWYLLNPSATAGAVEINWTNGQVLEAAAGVTLLSNVDQNNPFGNVATANGLTGAPSVLVETASGDLVLDIISAYKTSYTGTSPQTTIFSSGTNDLTVSSSYRSASTGSATNTLMQWDSKSNPYVIAGFAVKGLSNDLQFALSPALCSPLTIKSGTPITIQTAASVASGTASGTTLPIGASLTYGSNTLVSLSGATNAGLGATGSTGTLTWSGTLASDVTIPSGQALSLTVASDYQAANIALKFDEPTSGNSFVQLPVSNPVQVAVYDAAFTSGGTVTTTALENTTRYIRAVVNTPFGTNDITGLNFDITVGSTTTSATASLVADNSTNCTKTFEYAWTLTPGGNYSLVAKATNVQNTVISSAASSFTVVPVGCDLPVADVISTASGRPVEIDVLNNDPNQTIAPIIVTQPTYGTVTVTVDKKVTYQPFLGYIGSDSFTYKICTESDAPIATVTANMLDAIVVQKDLTHTFSTQPVSDATSYVWKLPVGITLTTNPTATNGIVTTSSPSIEINWAGVAPGIYEICVKATNSCGVSPEICEKIVIADVVAPPTYDVLGTVTNASCGSGGSIAIGNVLQNGGAYTPTQTLTYSWTGPAGFTSNVKDISNLVQGMYVLTVSEGSTTIVQKVFYVEYSCLGVAKTVSSGPVNNGDGTYTLGYSIKVENLGNTYINDILAVEDLATTFAGATYTVTSTSSGNFTVNSAFNGSTYTNLINPTLKGSLAPGGVGYITLAVKITPGNKLGTYENSVTATGVDPSGKSLSDISQDGTNTDPNGNGPGDNSTPTSVTFTENPVIGVAKALTSGPVVNGDGTYDLNYTITIRNMGDVPLKNVQVSDNLSTTFGAGATIAISSLISSDLAVNSSYNVSGDYNLLTGNDVMAVNDIRTIVLSIRVTPTGAGPFNNVALGSAKGPGGTLTTDNSQNGLYPDSDNDGSPTDNNDSTPVTFPENPQIGVAKRLTAAPVNNGDGTYNLTYEFVVKNTGNVPLKNVQVADDLSSTFPGKTITNISVSATGFTKNTGYTGSGTNTGLLVGTDNLAVGASGTISLTITVTPGSLFGPYNNTATASATSQLGSAVSDVSTDGTDVDPENDGPGNNSVVTPVTFTESPQLGVAKSLVSVTNNQDGTYDVLYQILVKNTGSVSLNTIQVTDNLGATFSGSTSFSVKSLTASGLTANSIVGFNGTNNLLSASNSLAVGSSGTISLTVTVTPGTKLGVYNNLATGSGKSPAGATVSDVSTDGNNVDPDGDNNPGNNSQVTPLTFVENPGLTVTKTAGTVTETSTGVYSVNYTISATNTGDVVLNNIQVIDNLAAAFPLPVVINSISKSITSSSGGNSLTINGSYNGTTDFSLLAANGSLMPGGSVTVSLQLVISASAGGIFENSVMAYGTSPAGQSPVSTSSAFVTVNENPKVGIAKSVQNMVQNGSSYTVTMELTVKNYGNVTLKDLKIFDDVVTQFSGMSITNISTVIPGTVSVTSSEYNILFGNAAWNGTSISNILAPGQELAIGQTGTVWIQFTVTPGSVSYKNNVATANATSPSGAITSDTSEEGLNPDSDTDNDPTDNNKPTLVAFQSADLKITKSVSNTTPNVGDVITYTVNVENLGVSNASGVAIKDVLPNGLSTIGAISNSGSLSSSTITWSGLTISSGSSVSLTYTAKVVAPGSGITYTNTASVTGADQYDPVTINNSDSEALNPINVISAVDDTYGPFNGYTGGTATTTVLTNDLLNGVAVIPSEVTITVLSPASNSKVYLDASTGSVTVTAGTPAGTYTITYQICEKLNPTNCDDATVTVTVTAAPIVATDDSYGPFNGYTGGTATSTVFANDLLNGVAVIPSEVSITVLSPASIPGVTLSSTTGLVSVAAGTPAGTYTITYKICEKLNPTNCDDATVTVTVTAAPIVATDDTYGPFNGYTGGTATSTVFANDLLNGVAVNPSEVTLTVLSPASNSKVYLDASTGSVTVTAGTPAGTYTITYQICEKLNPTNCDDATVTVTVTAAPIVAVDDSYGPFNGYTGGTATSTVFANDLLNGVAVIPSEVSITVLSPASNPKVNLDASTGSVTVTAGTPAGTYTITYKICEKLNPTNCDDATVTVTVTAAPIVATDDSYGPFNGYTGGTATSTVFANDLLNGVAVIPSEVTLTVLNDPSDGVTLDASTGSVTVTAGTPAGTYTITYKICEKLNPTNCDDATVTVTVTAAPIVATDDTYGPINGFEGSSYLGNILANDVLNGSPVDLSKVQITILDGNLDGVTLDVSNGNVSVASGTPAGDYIIKYKICEKLNPTNCDDAIVKVTVIAPPIVANNDSYGPVNSYDGNLNVGNVLTNDVLNGSPVDLTKVLISVVNDPADGVTLNAKTGIVSVAPNTPAGTYRIIYWICELLNPNNCDDATVTVTVTTSPIIANDDSYGPVNSYDGNPNVGNVLTNDVLNGALADLTKVRITVLNDPADGVSLNSTTGVVSVAPDTPAGTYRITYRICEVLNPTNCDDATVTVTVSTLPIIANDDSYGPVNSYDGNPNVGNVLTNDVLNGAPADLTKVRITVLNDPADGVSLNSTTGVVSVTPDTPAGTYRITYRICEVLNPNNCDDATVTVTVTTSPIIANDDSYGPVNSYDGNPNVGNVLTNDVLNGALADLTKVRITVLNDPADGVSLNSTTGVVSVAPDTPAGTYRITYRICEVLNPTNCDDATVTVVIYSRISGRVFDDGNGITDAKIDGTGTNINQKLYVSLVSSQNQIIATVPVAADGTYQFENVLAGTYGLVLNTSSGGSATSNLPGGWVHTAEGTSVFGDGSADGKIAITIGESISNANFGINRIPVANNVSGSFDNPGGSLTVVVPELNGLDGEDGVINSGEKLTIVTLPSNARLYYNGVAVIAGQIINNYDPAKLTVDPNDGSNLVSFNYQVTDLAGFVSIPANVSLSFIVRNDVPVAEDNTISVERGSAVMGSVVNNDKLSLDGGNVWTLKRSTLNGKLVFNQNGSYTYTPDVRFDGEDTFTYQLCDANGDCDEAVVTIKVVSAKADLSVAKTVDIKTPKVGEMVVFTVTVTNLGPDAATGVKVTDKLPSGCIYISSTVTRGSYDLQSGVWTIGDLIVGKSESITVKAKVYSIGDYKNTAVVEGDQNDLNNSNNTASVELDEICELFIPEIFSPNGDGIQDFFKIRCIDRYLNARIEIYNRWGNLVYKKDHYGDTDFWGATDAWWDGNSNQNLKLGTEKLPPATYFYVLYLNDGAEKRNGYLYLNR